MMKSYSVLFFRFGLAHYRGSGGTENSRSGAISVDGTTAANFPPVFSEITPWMNPTRLDPLAHGHPRHNRHSKPKPSPLLPIFNCLNGLVRFDPPFCYCHTEVEGNKCQFSTTSLPSDGRLCPSTRRWKNLSKEDDPFLNFSSIWLFSIHDCRCFVMADLPIADLQSAHVPFNAIRGCLGIGILLFYNWFFKLKSLPLGRTHYRMLFNYEIWRQNNSEAIFLNNLNTPPPVFYALRLTPYDWVITLCAMPLAIFC